MGNSHPTKHQDNSPQLWDKVWERPVIARERRLATPAMEGTVRARKIKALVLTTFGAFQGLKVVEVGGAGHLCTCHGHGGL